MSNSTAPQTQSIPQEYQFYIIIITLVVNTLISLVTPLISAAILVLKRLEKSKCCGGEITLKPENSIYKKDLPPEVEVTTVTIPKNEIL